MFLFVILTAELALLYTAFWYLYQREPSTNGRIKASLWGAYDDAPGQLLDSALAETHKCRCDPAQHSHNIAIPAYAQEFVLDSLTNRYVPARSSESLLMQFADGIDRTFGQLNVKP